MPCSSPSTITDRHGQRADRRVEPAHQLEPVVAGAGVGGREHGAAGRRSPCAASGGCRRTCARPTPGSASISSVVPPASAGRTGTSGLELDGAEPRRRPRARARAATWKASVSAMRVGRPPPRGAPKWRGERAREHLALVVEAEARLAQQQLGEEVGLELAQRSRSERRRSNLRFFRSLREEAQGLEHLGGRERRVARAASRRLCGEEHGDVARDVEPVDDLAPRRRAAST